MLQLIQRLVIITLVSPCAIVREELVGVPIRQGDGDFILPTIDIRRGSLRNTAHAHASLALHLSETSVLAILDSAIRSCPKVKLPFIEVGGTPLVFRRVRWEVALTGASLRPNQVLDGGKHLIPISVTVLVDTPCATVGIPPMLPSVYVHIVTFDTSVRICPVDLVHVSVRSLKMQGVLIHIS